MIWFRLNIVLEFVYMLIIFLVFVVPTRCILSIARGDPHNIMATQSTQRPTYYNGDTEHSVWIYRTQRPTYSDADKEHKQHVLETYTMTFVSRVVFNHMPVPPEFEIDDGECPHYTGAVRTQFHQDLQTPPPQL